MSKPYTPDPTATAGPLARAKGNRLSLYLPQEERQVLQDLASEEGISLSRAIRILAAEGLHYRRHGAAELRCRGVCNNCSEEIA